MTTVTVNSPMNVVQSGLGINPILTGIVQGYSNSEFVGSYLFPPIPSPARHGQIIQFGKEHFRVVETKRAPGSAIVQTDLGYKGLPFALDDHARAVVLPRETTDEAKVIAGIDLPMHAIGLNMDGILLNQEMSQATLATSPASYALSNVYAPTGTSQWSDPSSDPIKDVLAAREAVRSRIGRYPNTMVISALVFAALENHPKLIDRLKYTSHASITTDMLANWFKVDQVIVGAGVFSDDQDNFSDIWGKNAVLAYVPKDSDSMYRPSFGYNYRLQGYPLGENAYLNQSINSWVYNIFYVHKSFITSSDSGFLFSNVVA